MLHCLTTYKVNEKGLLNYCKKLGHFVKNCLKKKQNQACEN
jgi:hypothetical protein